MSYIIDRFSANLDVAIAMNLSHCDECGAPTTTPGHPRRTEWPEWAVCGHCEQFAQRIAGVDRMFGNLAEQIAKAAGKNLPLKF